MFAQKNSKKQGDVGLGIAIGWFCQNGLTVSIPLTDSQDYDLVVDTLDGLDRVQVKTTSYKRREKFTVSLSVKGGNRTSKGRVKKFDKSKVDSVFVITADNICYWIPVQCIESEYGITLGDKFDNFIV